MKGNRYKDYPDRVAKGVVLHREIDRYTDTHATVGQSKDRLRGKYRHYAGVIIDMFYDHYLAKYFQEYHSQPIADFCEHHYRNLESFMDQMPERAQNMLPYMIRGNWLLNYGKLEGIHRALTGMSRRTRFDSKMEEAVQELIAYYEDFKNEFESFFPELDRHISQFREDLINS